MQGLFDGIPDGYTESKKIESVPGIHPAADVVFRPALYAERETWAKRTVQVDGAAKAKIDLDMIYSHVQTLNGIKPARERWDNLPPKLVDKLLDLVLGYSPADEREDLKN